jgi:hypothetical protein
MIEAPCLRAASISQPVESDHLHASGLLLPTRLGAGLDQRLALLEAKTAAFGYLDADRDIDMVGDRQRRLQDVEMAVGQRVEGAGIEGDAWSWRCSLPDPANATQPVTVVAFGPREIFQRCSYRLNAR